MVGLTSMKGLGGIGNTTLRMITSPQLGVSLVREGPVGFRAALMGD